MADLKFVVLGTGFWSHYQISAWREVGGVSQSATVISNGAFMIAARIVLPPSCLSCLLATFVTIFREASLSFPEGKPVYLPQASGIAPITCPGIASIFSGGPT